MIADLKIINCGKSSYSGNWSQILPISGEITAYLGKRKKNVHFKTHQLQEIKDITDFRQNVSVFNQKILY